jgi:hypothetical protein
MGGLSEPLLHFALSLTGKDRPCVALLPTAGGEDDRGVVWHVRAARPHTPTSTSSVSSASPTARGSGSRPPTQSSFPAGTPRTCSPFWRVHGVDDELRSAWRRGAVLCGWSAGANCWFEASVTDSFRAALDPLHDGLAILRGSFCPHYDGEALRRPVYRELVDGGFTPGYAPTTRRRSTSRGRSCGRSSPRSPRRRATASSPARRRRCPPASCPKESVRDRRPAAGRE